MSRHPLGRPILGEIKTIRAVQREDLIRYIGAHYHPDETVLSVAGNFNVDELTRLLQRFFGPSMRPPRRRSDRWPPSVRGGLAVHEKSLEQAHLCLGLKGLPLDHKDRYAAFALNAVLGGSVSSRLFQEVREKRGLAYSIYSYASSFSDVGTLTVYAATRTREAPRVLELICREVQRLRRNGVRRDELERTRNQIKGNVMLGLESTQSRMSKLAKDELYLGRRLSLQEIMADIDRITNEQIHRLGEELFDLDCLSVTGLGPISHRSLQSALP
jgi:predicted Zn-dependent peptidase